MKKWLPLFSLLCFLLSCADDDFEEIDLIGSTFTHEIPNCNDGGNPEINCTEYVRFIDGSRVDALIGGDDVILRLEYSRSEDEVVIEEGPGITSDIVFRIQDAQTLIRLADGSSWEREVD